MKKAVSSVIAFLKKKKEDFSLLLDSSPADSDATLDQTEADVENEFAVIRLCRRCVLVYENKPWNERVLQRLLQQRNTAIKPNRAEVNWAVENAENTRSSDHFHGNLRQRFLDEDRDQTSMSLTLVYDHILQRGNSSNSLFAQNFGPHCPAFIWLRNCENTNAVRNIYEDGDNILMNLRLDVVLSFANPQPSEADLAAGTNMEIWVLAKKFSKPVITLKMDEEWRFFHIPFSAKERQAKIEAIFRAIDQILDISARVIMARGESPDSAITVKEVIIETATVVTSTAAESTATVGIETAAMALGQAAAGIAISVLVDIALTAGSVSRSKLQRDKGLITNSQFKSTVRRKLCDSGCQFIGGTTGTIVGQVLIPVPVVGAMVGGFFGSLIGVGVSKGIIKTSELIARAQNARAKAITDKYT
ncbi:hypothetical protein OS493_016509 [Desmophyllum pertusum]|uniref:Uncharacterized protein n=1 Tax=Desmophyllum pertusum TaxID=174260 RepID=A0A9X0D3E5_9CNID|nr:hypothetical protein OS493_016509 [Desmophyllum pertusum]